MKPRKLGRLSSAYLVRIATGLELSTKAASLDAEAKRRYSAFRSAVKPLANECRGRAVNTVPDSAIGKLAAGLDRRWSVVRNVFRELARLSEVHPLGVEAQTLLRTYFPNGLGFLDRSAQLQLQHGRALLIELEAANLSRPLRALVDPLLEGIREDQTHFQAALDAELLRVQSAPLLATLRKPALDALEAFVAYVALMAPGESVEGNAARILAPVDAVLATLHEARRARSAKEETLRAREAKSLALAPPAERFGKADSREPRVLSGPVGANRGTTERRVSHEPAREPQESGFSRESGTEQLWD